MKYILVLALVSFNSFSNEPECDPNDPLSKLASSIAVPNCLNNKLIRSAKRSGHQEICDYCKSEFELKTGQQIPTIDLKERQRLFLNSAAEEYKKNLIHSLVETLKLRSLPATGATYERTVKSCSMKNSGDILRDCKSKAAKDLLSNSKLFEDLNKQFRLEAAKILSDTDNFKPNNTLLDRKESQCFIPEKDLLLIKNAAIEDTFSPSLMEAILSLNINDFSSIENLFSNEIVSKSYQGNIDEITEAAKAHPFLAPYFESPQKLQNFLKTVEKPLTTKNLKKKLYTKENGASLDLKFASNCEDTFRELKQTICSQNFEDGVFKIDPFKNHYKLFGKDIFSTDDDFTTTDELSTKHQEILRYCEPSSPSISLTALNNKLSPLLSKKNQDQSISDYKTYKYDQELFRTNDLLCTDGEKKCDKNTFTCSLIKSYQEYKTPNTELYNLARTSNPEVNSVLRSMIGDVSNLDPKTKEIFIANGIIPKDDGSFTPQPSVPERQPDYFSKPSTPATAAAPVKPTSPAQTTQAQAARQPASTQDYSYRSPDQEYSYNSNPDLSDIMKDNEEMRQFQSEMKRRLLGLPQGAQPTKDQVKKMVRDSVANTGNTLTPFQEETIAQRFMESSQAPSTPTVIPVPQKANETANRAAVSGGPDLKQQWKSSQQNAALAEMAGAKGLTAKDIIDAKASASDKELTKVALNIAEDPRISLSDVLNHKLTSNDSETQLIKVLLNNKNDFLLQIKSMNFQIVFDENKNFNLLLKSGDPKEAARLRPQLEMFLKKLKV